jgi:hypothetical protein
VRKVETEPAVLLTETVELGPLEPALDMSLYRVDTRREEGDARAIH